MNETTTLLLEEMRGKMTAYAVQFGYYLSNLCVKTDAAALLSIEVELNGRTAHLEDAAGAGIEDDTHYFFYPKDKKLLPLIEEGILKAHPEFKLSHVKVEGAPKDNDEQIVAEIPPVDKDRHKQLKDAVGTLAYACKAQMDANSQLYNGRIALSLAGVGQDDQKAAKDAAQEICDWHADMVKQYQENKEKEIDDAFAAWQEGKAETESRQNEKQQAENDEAAFNMQMN